MYYVVDAVDLPYDNSSSSLAATQVQSAVDELDADVITVADALAAHEVDNGNPHGVTAAQAGADPAGTADAAVAGHEADAVGAHAAAAVSYDNSTSGLVATTVQAALDEIYAYVSGVDGGSPAGDVIDGGTPSASHSDTLDGGTP